MTEETATQEPVKVRKKRGPNKTQEMPREQSKEAASNVSVTRMVRKRIYVEESIQDHKDEKMYEPVTFRFWNEEQRGVPISYGWVDRWIKYGQCQGMFYDGQTYTLPRIVYEYYKNNCATPKYSNMEKEIVPGQLNRVSTETGKNYRFRLELV